MSLLRLRKLNGIVQNEKCVCLEGEALEGVAFRERVVVWLLTYMFIDMFNKLLRLEGFRQVSVCL